MKHQESYVRTLRPDEFEVGSAPPNLDWPSSPEGRIDLRRMAISSDAASDLELSLALLWRELIHGLCRVTDAFFTDDRCYLVLSSDGSNVPLHGRRLAILEAVLCGSGQKNVAIDLGLAASTVALNARLGLEQLGLSCKASRVHPLLMLAAKAGSLSDGTLAASLSSFELAGEQLRVVSVPRPDRRLFRVLPPAELTVIRYLVEGRCYVEIARLRKTATRTIANQITSVFRRMRVSGRNELITRLFFAEGLERAPRSSWPEPVGPVATHAAGVRIGALRSA